MRDPASWFDLIVGAANATADGGTVASSTPSLDLQQARPCRGDRRLVGIGRRAASARRYGGRPGRSGSQTGRSRPARPGPPPSHTAWRRSSTPRTATARPSDGSLRAAAERYRIAGRSSSPLCAPGARRWPAEGRARAPASRPCRPRLASGEAASDDFARSGV